MNYLRLGVNFTLIWYFLGFDYSFIYHQSKILMTPFDWAYNILKKSGNFVKFGRGNAGEVFLSKINGHSVL